jgi:hypothetical protein
MTNTKKSQPTIKTRTEDTATKKAPSQKVSKIDPAAAPVRKHNPERYAAFVEAERAAVNKRLQKHFDALLEVGMAEEKLFLIEVLDWWDSGFGHTDSGTKPYGVHEIPLFSAIQDRLNGMHLVTVDSKQMVDEVEKFITAKLEAGWQDPGRTPYSPQPNEEVDKRLKTLLVRQVQYFSSRCKRSDMMVLSDLIEQWETLTDNDEFWQKTEYPLAAAMELHLEVMKRRRELMA